MTIIRTSVVTEVVNELRRATTKHPTGFHSAHEGYAVLKEEVDELWESIKCQSCPYAHTREEALQVAAMAVRFVLDMDAKEVADRYLPSVGFYDADGLEERFRDVQGMEITE
jgi:hypothetical protein